MTLLITLYILSVLLCFTGIILYERKKMYIDQEALFFMMLFSVFWPIAVTFIGIVRLFDFLEKVVNKK